MAVQLYSTLQRAPVALPEPPHTVGLYVCGPTVYARAHIGNARPFIVFSWLTRYLRHRGYEAKFVHNITDVNDKIYAAAPGASAERAAEAARWYLEDVAALGIGMPDAVPKVTESVEAIKDFIEGLVRDGFAYQAGSDVYFRVARSADYGQLSGQLMTDTEDTEPSPLKESPRDFALWKGTKPGEDTSWDSPWGAGRPGWHIECSAMAHEHLGPQFDIHGGGLDLAFPHHENELAQSRAARHPFAQIWMHNGMLQLAGEKMAKSVGNLITIQEALALYGREPLLLFFLSGHWRGPLDWSETAIESAAAQAESFRNFFRTATLSDDKPDLSELEALLDDDFNTPRALALLHGWRQQGEAAKLRAGLTLFGLDSLAAGDAAAPAEVVALAEERAAARSAKDFARSDALRDQLAALGWEMRDQAEPPYYLLVPA